MHRVEYDLIELTLDIMKFVIHRITHGHPEIGIPKSQEELKAAVGETVTARGIGGEKAFRLFRDELLKATVPIDHPRHLAFVPGSPSRSAILFDLVTSATSIHGAYWMEGAGGIFCENEAMRWLVSLTGLPEGAFGVFTSGGTAANLSALVTAREAWRNKGDHSRERGIVIASSGAHSSVKAMARVMDVEVLLVETQDAMSEAQLCQKIESLDSTQRERLFAVVATGGTTNAGIVDDLAGIAKVCQEHKLWLHVDAAYGGGALAADSVRHLFAGIEKSDSITIDPHKWFFSPYDCGAVIYREPELAKQAHAQHGSYLDIFNDDSFAGFNPSDYQIQLTRRLRGLSLWFALAMNGTRRFKEAVERGIDLALEAAAQIRQASHLELVREPSLSCVVFRRLGWEDRDYVHWTRENQRKGVALVTPTRWLTRGEQETVTRFCFINPDTTETDIRIILDSMK